MHWITREYIHPTITVEYLLLLNENVLSFSRETDLVDTVSGACSRSPRKQQKRKGKCEWRCRVDVMKKTRV